jgi:hypothetical protein
MSTYIDSASLLEELNLEHDLRNFNGQPSSLTQRLRDNCPATKMVQRMRRVDVTFTGETARRLKQIFTRDIPTTKNATPRDCIFAVDLLVEREGCDLDGNVVANFPCAEFQFRLSRIRARLDKPEGKHERADAQMLADAENSAFLKDFKRLFSLLVLYERAEMLINDWHAIMVTGHHSFWTARAFKIANEIEPLHIVSDSMTSALMNLLESMILMDRLTKLTLFNCREELAVWDQVVCDYYVAQSREMEEEKEYRSADDSSDSEEVVVTIIKV